MLLGSLQISLSFVIVNKQVMQSVEIRFHAAMRSVCFMWKMSSHSDRVNSSSVLLTVECQCLEAEREEVMLSQ